MMMVNHLKDTFARKLHEGNEIRSMSFPNLSCVIRILTLEEYIESEYEVYLNNRFSD